MAKKKIFVGYDNDNNRHYKNLTLGMGQEPRIRLRLQ